MTTASDYDIKLEKAISSLGWKGGGLYPWDGSKQDDLIIVIDAANKYLEIVNAYNSQQAEIDRLHNPWISVEDELPKDGEFVDIWRTGEMEGRTTDVQYHEGFRMKHILGSRYHDVSHFMRQPQPPTTEG